MSRARDNYRAGLAGLEAMRKRAGGLPDAEEALQVDALDELWAALSADEQAAELEDDEDEDEDDEDDDDDDDDEEDDDGVDELDFS